MRAVRVRRALRQADVARRAGMSASSVSRIERGHIGTVSVDVLMRVAAILEMRIDLVPRWRGGELDRLLSARHSAMHEQVARRFACLAPWLFTAEATFAVYGERGTIDLLGYHPGRRALLVVELKTQLVDLQELLSQADRYRRLGRLVGRERGWPGKSVSVWVLMRDSMTNRRRVAAHSEVLRGAFPHDGHMMRVWLRDPAGPISALSFLSDSRPQTVGRRTTTARRVRSPSSLGAERDFHPRPIVG